MCTVEKKIKSKKNTLWPYLDLDVGFHLNLGLEGLFTTFFLPAPEIHCTCSFSWPHQVISHNPTDFRGPLEAAAIMIKTILHKVSWLYNQS